MDDGINYWKNWAILVTTNIATDTNLTGLDTTLN